MGLQKRVQEPQVLVFGLPSSYRATHACVRPTPPWGKNVKEWANEKHHEKSKRHKQPSSTRSSRRRHSRRGKAAFPQSCLAICHFRILVDPPEFPTSLIRFTTAETTMAETRRRAVHHAIVRPRGGSSLAVKRGGCGALGHLCELADTQIYCPQRHKTTLATFCNLTTTPLDHERTTRASHVTNARTWRNPV